MKNDPVIQQLSVLSLMAVFKDIAPGYRIRKLTEKETKEKVSQAVGRTREWEQGLVAVYQSYLLILEREIRGGYLKRFTCRQALDTYEQKRQS